MGIFGIFFTRYDNHWEKVFRKRDPWTGKLTIIRRGTSSVWKWNIKSGRIEIIFWGRWGRAAKYIYWEHMVGSSTFERMKALARRGSGLNSFINKYEIRGLKEDYEVSEFWDEFRKK